MKVNEAKRRHPRHAWTPLRELLDDDAATFEAVCRACELRRRVSTVGRRLVTWTTVDGRTVDAPPNCEGTRR